jgi:multiple sugar transport system permease protein/fructooligosaccharide transport system permease protein
MVLASMRAASAVFDFDGVLRSESWTLGNYSAAWRRADMPRALLTSGLQVGLISVAGLFVNALSAFAFARLQFWGRDWLFAGVVALVILPVEALAVPLLLTARDLGLTGGYAAALGGLTLPFVAKAFNIFLLRQHFMSLPRELEEAGALDGAGVWDQVWAIALPAIRPALVTVVLLDLLTHWNDFLWPLLIATRDETHTVQVGLANLFTEPPLDWGAIMACAVITTLPVLLCFRLFQRHLVPSDARAGLR